MLYAGCSGCRRTQPLICGGLLFPHMVVPAVATPMGVGCMFCGVVPPMFTCLNCFTTQHLYVQGARVAVGALQAQRMHMAPVVQAPQGASDSFLQGMMKDAAKSFAGEFGKSVASELFGAFFGGGG